MKQRVHLAFTADRSAIPWPAARARVGVEFGLRSAGVTEPLELDAIAG